MNRVISNLGLFLVLFAISVGITYGQESTVTFKAEDGYRFVYTWSRFEDTLSFRKVSFGPTNLVVKPFTRFDD